MTRLVCIVAKSLTVTRPVFHHIVGGWVPFTYTTPTSPFTKLASQIQTHRQLRSRKVALTDFHFCCWLTEHKSNILTSRLAYSLLLIFLPNEKFLCLNWNYPSRCKRNEHRKVFWPRLLTLSCVGEEVGWLRPLWAPAVKSWTSDRGEQDWVSTLDATLRRPSARPSLVAFGFLWSWPARFPIGCRCVWPSALRKKIGNITRRDPFL